MNRPRAGVNAACSGQQKNIAGLERRQLAFVVFDVVKIEIAFELIKNLIARIDMKSLRRLGPRVRKR